MTSWNKIKFFGFAVLLLAYAIIAGSLYLLGNHTLMWINGVSTIGEITNTQLVPEDEFQNSSTSSAPSNAYIVSFVTIEGDTTTFTTKFSSSFKLYNVAEKVTVVYWPSSPQNAKILSFMSLYLGPLLAIFMGSIFWLVGMFIYHTDKPKRRYIKN